MRYFISIATLLAILAIAAGCSSGGNNAVISNPAGENNTESFDSLPVIAFDGESAIGFLGAYSLAISPDFVDAELTPMRSSAEGESFIVSGKGFFTISPCHDCLKLNSIALDADGNIVLGMIVKHPFTEGDVLKPPTAINRLDLDVFDLALVVNPVEITPTTFNLTGLDVYPGILLNADGYTSEISEVTDVNSALPYKICYESEFNNRFEMGTEYQNFDVVIAPGTTLLFDLYMTMGYGASAKKPERLNPTYYVPEFNRKAAWKVEVTPPQGEDPPEIDNTWDDTDTTTEFDVTIDIYDWNHGATIAGVFPDPANTDQISASSDISEVTVEIPGMTSAVSSASTVDMTSNGWDDPLTYTAAIANENGLAEGEYIGLVKVTDSRVPGISVVGGEPDTLVHTPDGIRLEWYNIPEFTVYQTFIATVLAGGMPPVCDINVDTNDVGQGGAVYADPGTSNDPDGSITMYEYDADYDGVDFNAYVTQTSIDPEFGNPVALTMPCNSTGSDITVTVAIRVTDDDDPALSSICTTDITVGSELGSPGKVTADTVNRGEGIGNAYRITSIDLDWPDNACAVEFAIERANNGMTPSSWSVLDTTTESFYKFQPTNVQGVDRLRVIARVVVGGNPATDSVPSGEVLFIFDSHYFSSGHSWLERDEHNNGSHWNFNTSTWGFPTLDDSGSGGYGMASFSTSCHYGQCGSWPNSWCAWLVLVPDIVDQDAAYIDMYYFQDYSWTFGTSAAMVLGTSTGDVQDNAPTACDITPTQDHRDFTSYNNQCNAIDVEFCESGMWGFTGYQWWIHTSYWLNDMIDDADRDYFVLAWANGPDSGGNGAGYNDAQVIVVY